MTLPEILQQFDRLDKSSPQFPDELTGLLYKEGYKNYIPKLQDEDVVWLVEYLDNVLDTLDSASPAFRKSLRELGRICGTREKLPQSYMLERSLSALSKHPVASGGSGDVYKGSLGDSSVCIKRLRIYSKEESRGAKKTFHREAVMWKRLAHPNVAPLLGVTLEPLQLISTWMPNGELKEYIGSHPDTDRLALLSGIADGLNYLHSLSMVHGDLKGPNILVDGSGRPRITDFGLAIVAQNQDSVRSAQGEHGHTARWTAPEILNEKGTHSKEADVFSFAMVMVEAFTGEVPFHPNNPAAAMLAILNEKRPARPTHPNFTDELWTLMKRCWNQDPYSRPEMSEVLETLRSSDPPGDWDTFPTSSHTLVEPADQKMVKRLSNKDKEPTSGTDISSSTSQGEITELSYGSSQVAAHNSRRGEGNYYRDEEQEGQLSRPPGQSQSRRGTDQSEPQSPLPTDPAQVDSNQLLKPVNPHNDSQGNIGGIHQPGSRRGIDGASRSVLTLPDPNHTGSHGIKSRNPSRTHLAGNHSTNNLEGFGRSENKLPDSGVNANASASCHDVRTGTKSRNHSRMNLVETATPPLPKKHGIWCRIKRKLGCVSDENAPP